MNRSVRLPLTLLFALSVAAALASTPVAGDSPPVDLTADELLAASIAYHDPEGVWGTRPLRLTLTETRPDGNDRSTEVEIDPASDHFVLSRTSEGREVVQRFAAGECHFTVDGRSELEPEVREKLQLDCDRLERMRNYYVYLWGLPMKLRDPGTILGETVTLDRFADRPALALRVTYDPEVGGDTWIFYFHPADRRLIGYRFYHDEAKGDGEYILLEGEVTGSGSSAGLRLPASRAWYTHLGDEYLGTDLLESIE